MNNWLADFNSSFPLEDEYSELDEIDWSEDDEDPEDEYEDESCDRCSGRGCNYCLMLSY